MSWGKNHILYIFWNTKSSIQLPTQHLESVLIIALVFSSTLILHLHNHRIHINILVSSVNITSHVWNWMGLSIIIPILLGGRTNRRTACIMFWYYIVIVFSGNRHTHTHTPMDSNINDQTYIFVIMLVLLSGVFIIQPLSNHMWPNFLISAKDPKSRFLN